MQYLNDFRAPVIVLTGTLNPAILSPLWVANQVFGYDDGAVVGFHQAVYAVGNEMRQLTVLDGVGWSVTSSRCEVFMTSLDPEVIKRAEDFARKIVEILPHTPWGAMGINFQFEATGEDIDIVDKYITPEDLEGEFEIGKKTLTTSLVISPNLSLNIQRNIEDDGFSLFLNNHYPQIKAASIHETIDGVILERLEACRGIMTKYYQLTDETQIFLEPGEGEVLNAE